MPDINGWNKYQMYVMEELKRQGETQTTILIAINELKTDMAIEKSKLRWVTGGISAFVSMIFTSLMLLMRHLIRGV